MKAFIVNATQYINTTIHSEHIHTYLCVSGKFSTNWKLNSREFSMLLMNRSNDIWPLLLHTIPLTLTPFMFSRLVPDRSLIWHCQSPLVMHKLIYKWHPQSHAFSYTSQYRPMDRLRMGGCACEWVWPKNQFNQFQLIPMRKRLKYVINYKRLFYSSNWIYWARMAADGELKVTRRSGRVWVSEKNRNE